MVDQVTYDSVGCLFRMSIHPFPSVKSGDLGPSIDPRLRYQQSTHETRVLEPTNLLCRLRASDAVRSLPIATRGRLRRRRPRPRRPRGTPGRGYHQNKRDHERTHAIEGERAPLALPVEEHDHGYEPCQKTQKNRDGIEGHQLLFIRLRRHYDQSRKMAYTSTPQKGV